MNFSCTWQTELPLRTLLLSLSENIDHETHYVPRVDDGLSDLITVTNGFPLGCSTQFTIYVSFNKSIMRGSNVKYWQVGTNGYFTFTRFTGFTPFPFSKGNSISLVAPFFTDIDISNTPGRILYQVHSNFSKTYSRNVAEYVDAVINTNRSTDFSTQWLLIASWIEVSPFYDDNIVSFLKIVPSQILLL